MSSSDENENLGLDEIFTELSRPPTPEPTVSTYLRDEDRVGSDDWRKIDIRLVGSHPLWAHYLWNAALALASFLDCNVELCKGLRVLELGAGGALPSIVATKLGAKKVVITDYPDAALIENISYNTNRNLNIEELSRVDVQGYIWGRPIRPLVGEPTELFDLLILSDLIFNHSQHEAMLKTSELALRHGKDEDTAPPPCLLVFYSHHRPHLAHRDMEFFVKAEQRGWICNAVYTRTFPPMFPKDSGEESVRSTVHGWRLTRRS